MTTTVLTAADTADITLKAKHRAMWALGDYPKLAADLIWSLGPDPGRAPPACDPASGSSTSRPAPATPPSRPPWPAPTWSPAT